MQDSEAETQVSPTISSSYISHWLDILPLRWKVPEKTKDVQPELEFELVPKWLRST
jgi:hypothetical protein